MIKNPSAEVVGGFFCVIMNYKGGFGIADRNIAADRRKFDTSGRNY